MGFGVHEKHSLVQYRIINFNGPISGLAVSKRCASKDALSQWFYPEKYNARKSGVWTTAYIELTLEISEICLRFHYLYDVYCKILYYASEKVGEERPLPDQTAMLWSLHIFKTTLQKKTTLC